MWNGSFREPAHLASSIISILLIFGLIARLFSRRMHFSVSRSAWDTIFDFPESFVLQNIDAFNYFWIQGSFRADSIVHTAADASDFAFNGELSGERTGPGLEAENNWLCRPL